MPKPPHEPVSAKLAYLKLRRLPSLRGFRDPLNIMFCVFHFQLSIFNPHFGHHASSFWTDLVLGLHQSRAVLSKPPHEPVSAKLAYLKLRPLPPLRHFGVSLNTTIFGFTTILDNLDNPVQNHFRLSYYSPVTLFRFLYDFQTTFSRQLVKVTVN